MSLLLITHDLSIVEKMADTVCVMQHGELVEKKDCKTLFKAPEHLHKNVTQRPTKGRSHCRQRQ